MEGKFTKPLEFGTGGMRGIMGPKEGQINEGSLRRATQGFCNFLNNYKQIFSKISETDPKKVFDKKLKRHLIDDFPKREMAVVISFDTRKNSKEFAKIVALTFAANDIKVYLCDRPTPTPTLSFGIRRLNAIGGVNITASHNTKEYNGYKLYLSDGAQFTYPYDEIITEEIQKIEYLSECKIMKEEEAYSKGLIINLGDDFYNEYIKKVEQLLTKDKLIKEKGNTLKIVYTPFHGCGRDYVKKVFSDIGFTSLYTVAKQEVWDGEFDTVKSPNPENVESFKLALDLAKKHDADIVIGTDPDSDRLGLLAKDKKGKYVSFDGNKIVSLMCDYLLSVKKEFLPSSKEYFVVKSFVTTTLIDKICKYHKVNCYSVATGFKNIAACIYAHEEKEQIIFGCEESNGGLLGDFIRDKDGISAAEMISEIALVKKEENMTLVDYYEDILNRCGRVYSKNVSVTFDNEKVKQDFLKMQKSLMDNPPKKFAGVEVESIEDYKNSVFRDLKSNKTSEINLPKTDALVINLADGSKVCLRPSGTEPKVKYYFIFDKGR